MATAALPSLIRDQALDIITSRLGCTPELDARLEDFGSAVAVALMLDMEETFHILIDVDEVLPNGTVGVLIGLTEIRARTIRPVRPCNLIDLGEARARRARSEHPAPPEPTAEPQPRPITVEEADSAWTIVGIFAGTSLLAGAAAAILYVCLGLWS